ncbi:MAG TPA: hypothetical protein VKZ67_13950 [Natronosporangium sp.]|jgi:uncharacterized protein YukE|nr:hypothetical protein [Natronosporangium sp.]
MSGYVNLSEAGGLTQAGQRYDAEADDSQATARTFQGRMDQSQQGLRGRTGMQFTSMTTQHSTNLALLGRQFAQQAYRAVKGEQAILNADDEAHDLQSVTASTVDTQTSSISRPINV